MQRVVLVHGGDRAGKADAAAFDGVDALGKIEKFDVLLGDQELQALAAKAAEHANHFRDSPPRFAPET